MNLSEASSVVVQVGNQDSPFGGVAVNMPGEIPVHVELHSNPASVDSVFGRTGDVTAEQSDYSSFFALTSQAVPPGGTAGQVLTKLSITPFDTEWGAPGGATFHNPTASIGLTTVNGFATTSMRSDAAPPLDVSIAPTWGGIHTFTLSPIVPTPTTSTQAANKAYVDSASSGGDVSSNTSSSVDSEISLFSGTAGKTIKRATGTGIAKITSGVLSAITDNSTNWDTAFTERAQWDGGATNLVAATGRTSLGGTTVGSNLFTATNPSALTYPKISATNTVSFLTPAQVLTDIGAQASGSYQPLDSDLTTLAGLTATTDNFIVSVASAWASRTPTQVRTTLGLVIGTNVQAWDADLDSWAGVTRASGFDTFATTPTSANLKALITDETTVGWNLFTLANPTAITFLRVNADNTVTTRSAANFKTDLSLVSSDVGLGSVTNDAQTKAAIVPNTAPSAGQLLVGNVGGTAYAPVSASADATISSTGALTIANDAVTYAKMQNVTTARLLGRATAGSGDTEEITLGTNLSFTGTTLNAAGGGGSLTVGTSAIASGTATRVLYETSGNLLGEISGATSDGTTMTLTSPKVVTGINDTNGNSMIAFTPTASAVNGLTVTNAAVGGNVTLSCTGSSADINLKLTPKGAGIVILGDGTVANPILGFNSAPTTGLSLNSGFFEVSTSGVGSVAISSASLRVPSTSRIGWSSTTDPIGTGDTALNRNAAGVVEINNGTLGVFRDLRLRTLLADTGSAGAPTISFGSFTTTGLYGGSGLTLVANGTDVAQFLGTPKIEIANNAKLAWSSDATVTGTADLAIARNAAGVLEINSNTAGTYRDLILRNATLSGGSLNEAKGTDIASATTTDIGAATGNYLDVTGTVTITGLGTVQAGTRRLVRFTGALTLTHNATSLILPGAVNITTVAGDVGEFISLGSGNWRCVNYTPTTITGTGSTVLATSPTFVTPTLGAATATTVNGNTFTTGTYTLTGVAGKTLTFNKSLTLEGTDATTMTFPTTSATIARTDAANTFTGHQTVEGVTSTGATGTGKFVFDTSPTLVTPALGTPASGVLTSCTGTADGLTAGDVTRNHAVYAGASPPTVDVGPFVISKTGVDLKTAGTTTVFTVPTSRKFVCSGAFAIVTAVTGGAAGTETFSIKESGASAAMTPAAASGSATPVVGTYYCSPNTSAQGPYTACAAGNNVQVVVATSQAGSTTVTGTVFVAGFYTA